MATPPSDKKVRPPLQSRTPAGASTGTISSGVRLPRAPTAPLATTERTTSQRRESSTGPLPSTGPPALERRREQSLGAATGSSRPSGTANGYANSRARSSSGARRSPVAAAAVISDSGEGSGEGRAGARSAEGLDPQRVTRAVKAPVVKSVLKDLEPGLHGLFDELCGLTSAGLTQRQWQLAIQVLGRNSSGPEVRAAFLQSGDGSRLPFDAFQAALLHLCAAHGSIDGKDISASLARELRRWLVDEQQINDDEVTLRAKARSLVQEQARRSSGAGKGSPKGFDVNSGTATESQAAATPDRCHRATSTGKSVGRARTVPNMGATNSNSRATSSSSSLVFEPGIRNSCSPEASDVCAKSCGAETGKRSVSAKETHTGQPVQARRDIRGAVSLEDTEMPAQKGNAQKAERSSNEVLQQDIQHESRANEDPGPGHCADEVLQPTEAPSGPHIVASEEHIDPDKGIWEVNTTSKGWAPLAPALQPALDEAMSKDVDRIEVIIDPVARTWVRDLALLDESVQQRCVTYIALPREKKMGKIGGALPRPIRRRQASEEITGAEQTAHIDATEEKSGMLPAEPVERSAELRMGSVPGPDDSTSCREDDVDSLEGETDSVDDPLMFTAHPADGILINQGVLERIRQGAAERQACHRYSEVDERPGTREA